MTTRVSSLLFRSACVAAAVFAMSVPSSACWFPFWHGYSAYRPAYPAYYGPAYAPGCATGCSPCGSGGCGVQTYYGPVSGCSACGCAPCGCSPCGVGCGVGCSNGCGVDVGYAPTTDPVPDNGPAADSQRRTFADEEESSGAGVVEEPPMTPPEDDDFGPAERGTESSDGADTSDGTEADGTDPFPEFERPVLPMEDGDSAEPAPLEELDDQGITLRVSPARHRVRVEARYRAPRMVRLEVTPESPWQPASGSPAQIASK